MVFSRWMEASQFTPNCGHLLETCASLNCTGNGLCTDGVCRCFAGWRGEVCDRPHKSESNIGGIDFPSSPQGDAFAPVPPPEPACSLNGYRDPVSSVCRCSPGFEGDNCEKGNSWLKPASLYNSSPLSNTPPSPTQPKIPYSTKGTLFPLTLETSTNEHY